MTNYKQLKPVSKFWMPLLFLLISISLMACEKKQEEMNDPGKQEVQAFLNQFAQAMVKIDTSTLSRLMADDIVLRHITGATQTKQEWLTEIQNETMRYYSAEIRDLEVTIDGSSAVATYVSVLDARIWGSRNTWSINSTVQLEKRNNRWIRIG